MRDFSQFIFEIGGFALTFVLHVSMEGMLFFAKITENLYEKCFLSLAKSLRIAITVIGWGKNLSSWSCPVHEVEEQLLLKYWSKTGITLGVKDRIHMWTISYDIIRIIRLLRMVRALHLQICYYYYCVYLVPEKTKLFAWRERFSWLLKQSSLPSLTFLLRFGQLVFPLLNITQLKTCQNMVTVPSLSLYLDVHIVNMVRVAVLKIICCEIIRGLEEPAACAIIKLLIVSVACNIFILIQQSQQN